MRKMLFLLLAALMLSGCGANDEKPQFIHTSVCHEFLKDGTVTGTDDYFYTRNDQGLVICEERYQDGILFSRTEWEYDAHGNVIRVTEKQDSNVTTTEYRNTLDEKGQILRQETWKDGTRILLREITYDHRGNEVSHRITEWYDPREEAAEDHYTMTYNKKGELIRQELHRLFSGERCVSEYKNGLCIRQTSYASESNAVTDQWEYSYDKQGRRTREARYGETGDLKLYHEYVYDDTAHTMTRTCYYGDGTVDNYSDVSTYDEYGNEILLEKLRDGEVYWRIRYTYEPLETAP